MKTTSRKQHCKELNFLTSLVYSIGKERFGDARQQATRTPAQPNRRQRQIKEIRTELTSLKKAYRKAAEEENPGLQQLRETQRQQLTYLSRAEQLRNKRKKQTKRRAEFIANPYKFSKGILDSWKAVWRKFNST